MALGGEGAAVTPLTPTERSAAYVIQDVCARMYNDEIGPKTGLYLMDSHLRQFRPRCPRQDCRRVLTKSPWRGGMRTAWCRCGWQTRECSIELVPAVEV